MLAAFATLSCFKSRDKVACVSRKNSFANYCNSSSWLPISLLEIIILIESSLLVLFFMLYNYSRVGAKVHIILEINASFLYLFSLIVQKWWFLYK